MLINQNWIVFLQTFAAIYQPNTGRGISYIFSLSWELTSDVGSTVTNRSAVVPGNDAPKASRQCLLLSPGRTWGTP